MMDINSLPLISKIVLALGFASGIVSMMMFLRYPIMLILMKFFPEYREFVRKTLAAKKFKK